MKSMFKPFGILVICLLVVTGCSRQSPFGPKEIKDLNSPLKVLLKADYIEISGLRDIAISGSYAYLASNWNGLGIMNIADPLNPHKIGYFDTPQAYYLAVSDSFVYIADFADSIRIINVSNPATPKEIGKCGTPGYLCDIAVSGAYVYAAAESKLYVIDASNPTVPTLIGTYDIGEYRPEVVANNGYVYLASTSEYIAEVVVFDASTPSSLKKLGSYVIDGCIWGMASSFPYICITGNYPTEEDMRGGFWIIDISNPSNPQKVGFCKLDNAYPDGLAVSGNYAYIADCSAFRIIDILDLHTPSEIAFYKMSEYGLSIAITGHYAYVVLDNNEGCLIINTQLNL